MQTHEKAQFLKVLNGMAAMKKAPMLPEVLDLWWACMADWSIEDFKAAAIHVIKKKATFMPTPKDFEDLRKAGRPTAGEAWANAIGWAASGSYRDCEMSDELTNKAVRALGGYRAIAMCDEDKLHFLERRFCEHYETLEDVAATRVALPQIAARPDWLQLQSAVAVRKRLTQ
jgi:hypothetical protein